MKKQGRRRRRESRHSNCDRRNSPARAIVIRQIRPLSFTHHHSCVSSSSTRRHWPPALVLLLPHAAADSTAAACACASTRRTCTGSCLLATQVSSCFRSSHRTGVAKITAHAPRRCRYSAPQPCGTHAASFLVLALCPFSFFGRHSFLLFFCGTPRHASSHAHFSQHASPHQHARACRAHMNDAQRRTIRRAVRRSG